MKAKKIIKRNDSGFTLLEMLLALAILAVVFYSIMTVLNSYFGVLRSFTIERENIYEARMAMDQIVSHIVYQRNDKELTLSLVGTHVIGTTVYGVQYNLVSSDDSAPTCDLYVDSNNQLVSGVGSVIYAKHIALNFTTVAGNTIDVRPAPGTINNGSQFISIGLRADKDSVKEPGAACSVTTYIYNK